MTKPAATEAQPVPTRQLETIVRDRRLPLLRFIRPRVESVEDAEDIVQDVLLQLVRSADTLEQIEDITAWLFRVARNRVTDWYRRKHPLPISDSEHSLEAPDSERPDTALARETIWGAFIDALAEVPPKQREVFVMHELEGRPFDEIAQVTGERLNTLLSRKRYAVLALRKRLGPLYYELFEE